MEIKNLYKEERFDSFLNKTIILSSKLYFKRSMKIVKNENTILDNEDFELYLQNFIEDKCSRGAFESVELRNELNIAFNCLSDIEQAVIFLLFNKELSQVETAERLKLYSTTISKIRRRAIRKLREYMEGEMFNEE